MNDVALTGCAPEPLMSYLKALGVLRLVAEQADSGARLSWAGGSAQLRSSLDRPALEKFFLQDYRPTPILAPWNGGGGFYGSGSAPVDKIAGATGHRLQPYAEAITRIRKFIPKTKPGEEEKKSLLIRCRSEVDDLVVPWLDVCYALGEQGPNYFPLVGTGGNDGRLDFTNNFMQRLAEVIPFTTHEGPPAKSSGWLAAALFSDTLVELGKASVGQFNPGGIGGANAIQGRFEADSRVNPWDFVLMIEGVLLFAGSIARRLGANTVGKAVYPFSVESVAVGYGSATGSEETVDGSRAELWLPMWNEPAIFTEVKHLFAEGRAQLGRRQARNAVEFALAVNLLGVSRGVSAFARYGFLKRNGLAFLAAPLGRVSVTLRPQARLLDDPPLRSWLDRLRSACRDKEKTPVRYQSALRQIDRTIFEFANRSEQGNDEKYLLNVLAVLGAVERTLAREGLSWLKDKQYGWRVRPLQRLNPQWLDRADDGSAEFRLAASLAGMAGTFKNEVGPLRVFLEEVELKGNDVRWAPGSTSAVWSKRSVSENLAAIFRRRMLEAFREDVSGVPLASPRPAGLADIVAFLEGEIDEEKLADLTWGLSTVDWSMVDFRLPARDDMAIPVHFALPRLLAHAAVIHAENGRWQYRQARENDEPNVVPESDVFHALANGRSTAIADSVDRAARRLKSGGLIVTGYRYRYRPGKSLDVTFPMPAPRLLAAMLFPLSNRELVRIANAVLYPPESED